MQDCPFYWSVAPSRRRYLGVRHPLPCVLGVYLFLPFGLGPSPRVEQPVREGRLSRGAAQVPRVEHRGFCGRHPSGRRGW